MLRRKEIDGLRAVAILPVVFCHAGFQGFGGGFVGVDIFFVISGYLISSVIIEETEKGKFSFVDFYERRARRIAPALLAMIVATIPLAFLIMKPAELKDFFSGIIATLTFVSNYYFLSQISYFSPAGELNPILHTWSLGIEEQFYIIFPMLLAGLLTLRKIPILFPIIIIAVVSFYFAEYSSKNEVNGFYFLHTRVWELLAGTVLATILAKKHPIWGRNFFSLVGVGLIIFSIAWFDSSTPHPGKFTLFPVLGAVLIILYATPGTLVHKGLTLKPLLLIGLSSYSIYLWHQPLFAFFRLKKLAPVTTTEALVLTFGSLIFGWLSWKFVEEPFRDRALLTRKRFLWLFANGAALALCLSLFCVNKLKGPVKFESVRKHGTYAHAATAREVAIKLGICHFRPGESKSIGHFLSKWQCDGRQSDGHDLQPMPVAVMGDSYAADYAMALRSAGLSPLQIGGASCSLTPSLMKKYCKKIFDFAKMRIKNDSKIKEIWLANRFKGDELDEKRLSEAIDYWKTFNKKIVFFVGRVGYPYIKNRVESAEADAKKLPKINPTSDLKKIPKSAKNLAFLETNVLRVIDGTKLTCIAPSCDYKDSEGRLLFVEHGHLSVLGAQLVGERIVKNIICNPLEIETPVGNGVDCSKLLKSPANRTPATH